MRSLTSWSGLAWLALVVTGVAEPVLGETFGAQPAPSEASVLPRGALAAELTAARLERLRGPDLAGRLEPFGPRELLELLVAGRYEAELGGRAMGARSLTSAEREGLFEAVAAAPSAVRNQELDAWLAEGPGSDARRVLLEHFGRAGRSSDLGGVLAWSQPGPGAERPGRALVDATEAALRAWFERDPQMLGAVPRLVRGLPLGSLPGLCRAVASGGGLEHVEALSAGLGIVPEFDPFLLSELGLVASQQRRYASSSLRGQVRAYLDDPDPRRVQEAIAATERLDDWDALPKLIELMEHEDPYVVELAFNALGSITGEGISKRASAWREWRAELSAWFEREAPGLVHDVEFGSPAEASRALMELARERHRKHELALAIVPGLERPEREVRTLAAASLGALGSTEAVPALLVMLAERDVELRRAAYLALCRVTGEDHADSPENWRNAGW